MVIIHTSKGDITVNLFTDKAPETCKNFIKYANEQHYTGTIFHRVIKGFMIQGGGLTADMRKKDTDKPIKNEADNGLKNSKYTIAMARTAEPHSATSQFSSIQQTTAISTSEVKPKKDGDTAYSAKLWTERMSLMRSKP